MTTTLFLEDAWQILRAKRSLLLGLACAGALFGMGWRLQEPLMYRAEATFRQEAPKRSGIAQLLQNELGIGEKGGSSDPTLVMSSRSLVEDLVDRECLQARLQERTSFFPDLAERCRWEAAWWLRSEEQERPYPHIQCTLIDYPRVAQMRLLVQVNEEGGYSVCYPDGTLLGSAHWGEPLSIENIRLALVARGQLKAGSQWDLTLLPRRKAVKMAQKRLRTQSDSKKTGLVKIEALHHVPEGAASMANGLMSAYRNYLMDCEDERLKERMAYLRRRQEDSRSQVRGLMTRYAERLAERASSSAFMGLEAEMQYLAERQEKTLERLLGVELQLQQLEGLPPRDAIHLIGGSQAPMAQELVGQLHHHQLQTALLDQSLEKGSPLVRIQQERQQELARTQSEIQQALAQLDQPLEATRDVSPLTQGWWQRMDDARALAQGAPDEQRLEREKEVQRQRQLFEEFLQQTDASIRLQQQLMQEAAIDTHAFDGLDPQAFNGLYLQYEQQQREAESRLHQASFLLEQIAKGNWEGAGSAQNIDPALGKLLDRATALQIKIGNPSHYSPKEIRHFQEEYNRMAVLLGAQLRQQTQLEQLRVQLVQSKLWELRAHQKAHLAQRMELLDQQIGQCIASSRFTLRNEQNLLRQQMSDMASTLRKVPDQWVAEQELTQAAEVETQVLAKTVEVAEAQMLAHHLEQLEARPLDAALAPLKPTPPFLVLATLAGALGGLFVGGASLISWRFFRGLRASRMQLQRLGARVLGALNPPADQATSLRRLAAFLEDLPEQPGGRVISLLMGSSVDYSAALAQILTTMGGRCVLVEAGFNTEPATGLLSHLERRTPLPKLQKQGSLDRLPCGGTSPCGFELLKGKTMAKVLAQLRNQYNWVFLASTAPLSAVQHMAMQELSDATVITVQDETIEELAEWMENKKTTAFLLSRAIC